MTFTWMRRGAVVGLGFAGLLTLIVAGCGGDQGGADKAVVYPEQGVNIPTANNAGSTAGSAGGTSAAPAPAASTTATPSKSEPAAASGGWGTLKGQVVFEGNPPAPEDLVEKGKAPKDETYCAKDGPIKSERLVVDGASKGVKNVLVYIPKPTAVNEEAKSAATSKDFVFDQKGCVFEPHVVAFMNGGKLTLKSSDQVNHNVDAKLKANSIYNQILASGQSMVYSPNAGERTPCEVICDIHPWMKAYWLILDSPYFAVTDDKGNFEIKNVPSGAQKVVVWQEAVNKGFVTAPSGDEVNIKAGDTTTQNFKIDGSKVSAAK